MRDPTFHGDQPLRVSRSPREIQSTVRKEERQRLWSVKVHLDYTWNYSPATTTLLIPPSWCTLSICPLASSKHVYICCISSFRVSWVGFRFPPPGICGIPSGLWRVERWFSWRRNLQPLEFSWHHNLQPLEVLLQLPGVAPCWVLGSENDVGERYVVYLQDQHLMVINLSKVSPVQGGIIISGTNQSARLCSYDDGNRGFMHLRQDVVICEPLKMNLTLCRQISQYEHNSVSLVFATSPHWHVQMSFSDLALNASKRRISNDSDGGLLIASKKDMYEQEDYTHLVQDMETHDLIGFVVLYDSSLVLLLMSVRLIGVSFCMSDSYYYYLCLSRCGEFVDKLKIKHLGRPLIP